MILLHTFTSTNGLMTDYNSNRQLIIDAGNDLLIQYDYTEPKFTSYVKLTAAAKEWDRRYYNNDPWESLAVRDVDKNGKPFMRAKHPSDKDIVNQEQWFKPDGLVTKDGYPIIGMLSYEGEYITRYMPTADVVERIRSKDSFTITQKVDYGKPWWETGAAYNNMLTGSGSKDAPQSPIWGYKLPHKKVAFENLKHRIDNYASPVFMEVLSFSSHFAASQNTLCVPCADEVTIHLEPSLNCQAFGMRHAKEPRKYRFKEGALNRSLNAAFMAVGADSPKEKFDRPLTLNTSEGDGEGTSWIPVTSDGMEKLIEVDEYHRRRREAALQLENIRKAVGEDKYLLLVLSAQGKTNKEISEELRANGKDVSTAAVAKSLQRIRKSLNTLKGGN